MLTEDQIQRRFRKMLANGEVTQQDLERAEALIEQLRWESPLRHRLIEELDEVRRACPSEG